MSTNNQSNQSITADYNILILMTIKTYDHSISRWYLKILLFSFKILSHSISNDTCLPSTLDLPVASIEVLYHTLTYLGL